MASERLQAVPESNGQGYARWFLPPRAIGVGLGFVLAAWLAHVLALRICAALSIEGCAAHWPISVYELRAPPDFYYLNQNHVLAAIAAFAIFAGSLWFFRKLRYILPAVVLVGFILILGSNLTQGVMYGLRKPIDGLGLRTNQYYHDALKILDPVEFFQNYPVHQPTLQTHSRSHPPGAILTMYFLIQLLGAPALIALAICAIATPIAGISLYSLLREEFDSPDAGYLTFLFLLIPAIQIYFLATLDALVVAMMLAVFALVVPRRSPVLAAAGGLVLVLLSMLTFLFVIAVPPVFYYWWRSSRRTRGIPLALGTFVLAHLLILRVTGFSYVQSFITASRFENPNGYGLLLDPSSFIMIRIEGLAEFMLFAGPFVLVAAYAGWKVRGQDRRLLSLTSAGIASLLAIMAAGAYRTGEAARAAMFMYPLLIIPIGALLKNEFSWDSSQARLILTATFFQGILMQLAANYFW